jgi:diguanylate cyclase
MRMRGLPRSAAAWMFLAVALSGVVAHGAGGGETLGSLLYPGIGLGAIVAVAIGVRRNDITPRWPWRWAQASIVLSVLGGVVRVLTAQPGTSDSFPADLIGLASYACLLLWLAGLLRSTDPRAHEGTLADGLLVGVGALMAVWVLLVSPTLSADASLPLRVMSALFPVLDAVTVFLILRLTFSAPRMAPAMWLLTGGMTGLLVADVLWGMAVVVQLLPAHFIDAFDLGAIALVGGAALHPSLTVLNEASVRTVRPLESGRLLSVALAFATPALLVWMRALERPADRLVVGAGLFVTAVIVLARVRRAVNRHAASEERLAHQATHDALTGLPNRVLLGERLQQLLASPGSGGTAVLFLDLDGFKYVNDTWGHSLGDDLLVAVGRRLREVTREHELVARVGGDEFVLALRSTDPDTELVAIAERLLRQFQDPYQLAIGEVFVGASIGITHSRLVPDGATNEELIRDADVAMYQAKAAGRGRWAVFEPVMRQLVTARLQTERDLRRALDRGELRVHYQPLVDVTTERVIGFEALVRWQHPERGLVPPMDFIPVIEDTDLILPVGALVLRTAAQQVAAWRAESASDLYMSVNVAARQLRDPDFVDLVRGVLREAGLPGGALSLEITETALVQDLESTADRLGALRALGVGLSVDDFGTGYSSLRYLKRLPVNQLKIDRAFIDGLGSDRDDEVIVEAVLAMGHALGLSVVAEGVETVLQLDRLRALGCDIAQGFLYGRPAPAADVGPLPEGSKVSA